MPQPDPALLLEEQVTGPGTHVLLVGIGTYPCLVGGREENLDVADGMEQLTSPPQSVRALAAWFLDNFQNPDQPLASLAAVISEPKFAKIEHPRLQSPAKRLPRGDAQDVISAIRRWLDRASLNPGNQAIIFLSGHGIVAGNSVLLCRDYGEVPNARFDGAINLETLISALATKPPGYQLIIIDACRTPDWVIDYLTRTNSFGRNAVDPSSIAGRKIAKQSIHFATSTLAPAYGRPDNFSVYTQALLLALDGGGCVPREQWWVTTDGLQTALASHTGRLARAVDVTQEPDRVRSSTFRIHKPAKASIPVLLHLDPEEGFQHRFNLAINLDGTSAGTLQFDPAKGEKVQPWVFDIKPDKYKLTATFLAPCPLPPLKGTLHAYPPEGFAHLNENGDFE